MANKDFKTIYIETGVTLYLRAEDSSGNFYDDSDGTYKAWALGNVVNFIENTNNKYLYEVTLSKAALWPDGIYYVTAYKQVGGSPHATNDVPVSSDIIIIDNNAEVIPEIMRGTDGANTTTPPTASAIASAVWANTTRTLSSFGTLISDIWSNVTRTLTAGTKDAEIDAIKEKTDKLPSSIVKGKQLNNIPFFMRSLTTGRGVSGLKPNVYVKLDGDDFVLIEQNSNITESEVIDGIYEIPYLTADETNADEFVTLYFQSPSAFTPPVTFRVIQP